MIVGPACNTPVAENNIKVIKSVVIVKVVLTKGRRTDNGVSFLGFVLLRNGRLNEVTRFNTRIVSDLDEDVAWLDI